jgi:hypothetical protein
MEIQSNIEPLQSLLFDWCGPCQPPKLSSNSAQCRLIGTVSQIPKIPTNSSQPLHFRLSHSNGTTQ